MDVTEAIGVIKAARPDLRSVVKVKEVGEVSAQRHFRTMPYSRRLELAIYKQCSKTHVGYITRGGPHIRVLSSVELNTSCGNGSR